MKQLLLVILLLSSVTVFAEDNPTDPKDFEISYDIFKEAHDKLISSDTTKLVIVERKDYDYVFQQVKGEPVPYRVYRKDHEGDMILGLFTGILASLITVSLFKVFTS